MKNYVSVDVDDGVVYIDIDKIVRVGTYTDSCNSRLQSYIQLDTRQNDFLYSIESPSAIVNKILDARAYR